MRGSVRLSLPLVLAAATVALGCEADESALLSPESSVEARSEGVMPQPSAQFRAHLTGAQEVPSVNTRARGEAQFRLSQDGTELSYRLIVANIENVLMAHIHLAAAGVNGPVVVWLYPDGPPPQLIEGRFSGVLAEGVITADDLVGLLADESLDALIDELTSGGAYVNVHTTANPGGEIRGQIE